ncbi:MAG: protein kinase [Acidobacteriota bacterium]|jgi:hypothetical protein
MIGASLGHYEILDSLGAGGMGEVYRARDSKLNREVAIKVLPAHLADDPERLARLQREAQVLAALNHPNIAAIYGLEEAAVQLAGGAGGAPADGAAASDGATIHFIVQDFGRNAAVVVAPLAGFDSGRAPFWHPDGEVVGYPVMAEDNSNAILFVDARGGGFVGDAHEDAFDGAFSPDGEHLAFIRDGRIWVGERFGRNASPFPSDAEDVFSLTISPDGRYIAYQIGSPAGDGAVFVERFPDGGGRVALGTGYVPRFGAGGRSLFFSRLAEDRAGVAITTVPLDPDTGALSGEPRAAVVVDILAASRNFSLLPDDQVVTLQPVAGPPAQNNILLIEDWQRLLERER